MALRFDNAIIIHIKNNGSLCIFIALNNRQLTKNYNHQNYKILY